MRSLSQPWSSSSVPVTAGAPSARIRRSKSAIRSRAFVTSILNGSLRNAKYVEHPIFGLRMPTEVPGVPSEVLDPRNTWNDKAAYDAKAKELAKKFRDNDARFQVTPEVRAAGPRA